MVGERNVYGGRIPDRIWRGEIETTSNEIKLKIRQKYDQPGARLFYVQANIEYGLEIAKNDVNVVRRSLVRAGLEKKV
ncbi:MAG: hypothetical protein ABH840_00785 [Nanoarchaeota archaeon]